MHGRRELCAYSSTYGFLSVMTVSVLNWVEDLNCHSIPLQMKLQTHISPTLIKSFSQICFQAGRMGEGQESETDRTTSTDRECARQNWERNRERNERERALLAAGQSPQTVSTTTEGWAFENQPSTQLCPPEAITSNDTSSAQLNIAFHQL